MMFALDVHTHPTPFQQEDTFPWQRTIIDFHWLCSLWYQLGVCLCFSLCVQEGRRVRRQQPRRRNGGPWRKEPSGKMHPLTLSALRVLKDTRENTKPNSVKYRYFYSVSFCSCHFYSFCSFLLFSFFEFRYLTDPYPHLIALLLLPLLP